MRLTNRITCSATLVLITAGVLTTGGIAAPQSDGGATIDLGGRQLRLQAQAKRSMLFGAVDLYSVGVYLPRPVAGVEALRQKDFPKAIRVGVLYDGSMPGKVPADWWKELMPALGPKEEDRLRQAFSKLSSGEDVWITYTPSGGSELRYGGKVLASTPGDKLMNAILDLWFGKSPVSQQLHEELVSEIGN